MPDLPLPPLADSLNTHHDLGLDLSAMGVRPLPGGNSNLTYLLTCGARQWVLRRPPEHGLNASAHSTAREWRLLTALHHSGVRGPVPVAHTDDADVIGAPFLVTAYVPDSVSITDTLPVAYLPDAARALGPALVDALVAVQAVDWRARGLEGFGRPEGFLDRQVPRWEAQYRRHEARTLPDLDVVTSWLRDHRPVDRPPAVVHGDFHLDNCLFAASSPWLLAVIGWEMATIGDRLLDLGLLLALWGPRTTDPPGMPKVQAVTRTPSAPTRADLAQPYADAAGRNLSGLRWYFVFGLWKLGAIVKSAWDSTSAANCICRTPRRSSTTCPRCSPRPPTSPPGGGRSATRLKCNTVQLGLHPCSLAVCRVLGG